MKLDDVLRLLDGARSAAKFIVFDACRNELQLPTKDTTKGLVPVAEQQGMFIAYASAPGRTASDMGDKSGPYAAALAAELGRPGLDHLNLFQNVKEGVLTATGGAQQPWESNGLGRRVYLTGRPPQAAVQEQLSDASREWSHVDKTSIAELETFLQRHGSSSEADYARARLADLKKQQGEIAEQAANAAKQKADNEARAKAEAEQQRLAKQKVETTQEKADRLYQSFEEWKRKQIKKKADDEGPAKAEAERQRLAMLQEQKAEAARKRAEMGDAVAPGRVFRDCADCPEMVVVPAGRFTMGSPKDEPQSYEDEDQLAVSIAKPFAVGRFAVTRNEFAAFVAATGHKTDGGCFTGTGSEWKQQSDKSWRSPGFTQNDRHPVVCVNWDDAKAYAAWLSKKTGKSYRLPSEAEREYVTRAGTTTPFWWGSAISSQQANYDGTAEPYKGGGSKGEWRKATVSVDTFKPNPWGLYNVHGNVWEWTEDCWNDKNAGNPGDGSARTSGDCSRRVVRGGSWFDDPRLLRSADRARLTTDGRSLNFGFRVARTLNP